MLRHREERGEGKGIFDVSWLWEGRKDDPGRVTEASVLLMFLIVIF